MTLATPVKNSIWVCCLLLGACAEELQNMQQLDVFLNSHVSTNELTKQNPHIWFAHMGF